MGHGRAMNNRSATQYSEETGESGVSARAPGRAEGPADPNDDRLLLAEARAGSRKAFAQIVERYRERVYFAALKIVRNPEDARDISQEAFVRVFQTLDRFELSRPFYPWIYRITRNLCLDHLNRHGPGRQLSLDSLIEEGHQQFADLDSSGSSSGEVIRENIHRTEMLSHMRRAIEELKPEFREILIMKHLEGMAYKDIAETLEIPIGTVMSRLYHARKALASEMAPHGPL